MAEFRMPSLGADMEAGTLVEWMIKPGDRVKRGDIVAVVETQKGAIEVEIFETGRVEHVLVEVGAKVPVGTPLALIRAEGEAEPRVRGNAAADSSQNCGRCRGCRAERGAAAAARPHLVEPSTSPAARRLASALIIRSM